MSDVIGQAEQELERISNTREAGVYHRRWLGVTGTLRLMSVSTPGFSPYYRCLHREWRRRATAAGQS